ncbi:MAG: CHAT domain-containing protein [Cyanobacteriota bacterium]
MRQKEAPERLAAVSRLVLAPLQRELAGVRELFVSPDGELNRLPFAALPVAAVELPIRRHKQLPHPRQLPLQRRQHQPAHRRQPLGCFLLAHGVGAGRYGRLHRRIDRLRLTQLDGANRAIGAQQQGQVAGWAVAPGAEIGRSIALKFHQHSIGRQQPSDLRWLHHMGLDLWQLAVKLLLQPLPVRQQ